MLATFDSRLYKNGNFICLVKQIAIPNFSKSKINIHPNVGVRRITGKTCGKTS